MFRPLALALLVPGCVELPIDDGSTTPDRTQPTTPTVPTQTTPLPEVQSAAWWRHPKWPQLVFARAEVEGAASFEHDGVPLHTTATATAVSPLEGGLADVAGSEFPALDVELVLGTERDDVVKLPSVPVGLPVGVPEHGLTVRWAVQEESAVLVAHVDPGTIPVEVHTFDLVSGQEVGDWAVGDQLTAWTIASVEEEPAIQLHGDIEPFTFGGLELPQPTCTVVPSTDDTLEVRLLGLERPPESVQLVQVGGQTLPNPAPGRLASSNGQHTAVVPPRLVRDDYFCVTFTFGNESDSIDVDLEFDLGLDPSRPPGMPHWEDKELDVDGDGEGDARVQATRWGTAVLLDIDALSRVGTPLRVVPIDEPERATVFERAGSAQRYVFSEGAAASSTGLRVTLQDGGELPLQCTLPPQ